MDRMKGKFFFLNPFLILLILFILSVFFGCGSRAVLCCGNFIFGCFAVLCQSWRKSCQAAVNQTARAHQQSEKTTVSFARFHKLKCG